MSIRIRTGTINDIDNISYLGRKTFNQTFGHLFKDPNDLKQYLETTFSMEKLKSSIVKPENVYWIVFYNSLPVGYAKIKLRTSTSFVVSTKGCKLQKIYILKEYLSKGIGTELQNLIFDTARKNYSEYIWLSVLKSNEKAVNFYKKEKYEIVGEHPFSIGKESFEFWTMSKEL